ncbi:hypothetical protein B1H15_21185 [Pseudomonas aeruginosa]|nr:hypothetical protein B1H15_21185 [Pseudomonas aeruginosa]
MSDYAAEALPPICAALIDGALRAEVRGLGSNRTESALKRAMEPKTNVSHFWFMNGMRAASPVAW